jgi:arylformamidase
VTDQFIDISMRVDSSIPRWPGSPEVRFEHARSLDRGDSNNVTHLTMDVHTGTHVDAPSHFIGDGETIDLVGLAPFVGAAVVVDTGDARELTVDVLESAHIPSETRRVLFKTANSAQPPCSDFRREFTALTPEAAAWLVREFDLLSLGIDYLSVQPYSASDDVHKILLSARVGLIEGLDLRRVDPGTYELLCLPLNLIGVEAAPARALLRVIPKATEK